MTVSLGRTATWVPSWRRLRVSHLSWVMGAYFLGSVFVSIADQLFGAPPPPTVSGAPTPYHHAWCYAQLAGLRVELETQARGALAGAAFDRIPPAQRRAWYPRWQAWHQRAADGCRLPQLQPLSDCFGALAALGVTVDEACTQIGGLSAPQRQEVDQRLRALRPSPTLGARP